MIAIEDELALPNGGAVPVWFDNSTGCSGFDDSVNADSSDVDFDSKRLLLRLGVLVEIGIDKSPRLGGNLPSRLAGADGLKPDDVVLAKGGKALLDRPVVGRIVLGVVKPVGGVNNGAGCNDAFAELGNGFEMVFDSKLFEFPSGDVLAPDEELDEKPFGGVLLNISKPVAAFPGLPEAIGPGPDTSGIVWSKPISPSNSFEGKSVPFMAT